ncbi:hypothetical protein ACEUZ9_000241 [Paracoccus litorisediminis]|jgi:hypothetical protein
MRISDDLLECVSGGSVGFHSDGGHMNWEFFEDWADIPQEHRKVILDSAYGRMGPFRDLVMSAPNRHDLDEIRAALSEYKATNAQ